MLRTVGERLAWVVRTAVVVVAGALLVTSVVTAVAPRLWRIANAHTEVPVEFPPFADLAQRSYAYDAAGDVIAVFELENSQPVALGDVPGHVIDAFLAVEDREFFVHHGVNVRSLFRAVLSNFATDGPVQGASTITMQVVKNDYLAGLERDGRYKILQAVYAVRLEKATTKQAILERYLNTVFFGQNSYGIGAAAETYFGKQVADLTLVEAAFLAGLVQAPTSYDPIINPERSRLRFEQVLDRLESEGLIGTVERAGIDRTFALPVRVLRRQEQPVERSYFTEALRDLLLNRSDILGETYEERYTRLYRGGLHIHTTLDPRLQARAEEARTLLPDNAAGIDAAIISLESRTGAIRAMVGGRGFEAGENEVNLALAPSQTGSSIKVFILAAALQAGAQADDLIDGTHPCRLPNVGDPDEPFFDIVGGVNGGLATLRRHTVRSINCAYARLSQIVGLERVVDTVYRMAGSPYLYRGQPVEDRNPVRPYSAFATGANELSTLDMASGIQTIANEGVHMDPYSVEYIDDSSGNRWYTHVDPGTEVLDRQVALRAIDILKGVLTEGTASRELSDFAGRRPAFGKTGTQQNNWTAFFVGATRELSTAVMVRDPDRYTEMRDIPEFVAVGIDRVQGGTFPAMIWEAFMDGAGLEQLEFADWERPEPPGRPPARLYLPGNECVFGIVPPSTTIAPAGPPPTTLVGFRRWPATPPTTEPVPPTTPAPTTTAVPTSTAAPSTTAPVTTVPVVVTSTVTTTVAATTTLGATTTSAGPGTSSTSTTTTTLPPPITVPGESGTTIPADVLDPDAPMPSVPLDRIVGPC